MKLSHSKLSKILSCPMSYRLSYELGIGLKQTKPALEIGSAVHWGIEHDTCDLSKYFDNLSYSKEHLLSEAMVSAYLNHKDEIFKQILRDPNDASTQLTLVDELHELYMTANLKSNLSTINYHEFVGIIDLLLLTNKGFIVIDYKTSSFEPDWDGYLDQIYRYIYLLRSQFPNIPVVKIGIVNIRKSNIRQKKTENQDEFLNRLKFEYEANSQEYICYHEFSQNDIDERLLNDYILNLSTMSDMAQTIVDNKLFFINYSNAKSTYGKSDFYDIFYHTKDAYVLYNISDCVWDEDEQMFKDKRDCIELDMRCADKDYAKVLNKYDMFESFYIDFFKDKDITLNTCTNFIESLRESYYIDDNLIQKYMQTYKKRMFVLQFFGTIEYNHKYEMLEDD